MAPSFLEVTKIESLVTALDGDVIWVLNFHRCKAAEPNYLALIWHWYCGLYIINFFLHGEVWWYLYMCRTTWFLIWIIANIICPCRCWFSGRWLLVRTFKLNSFLGLVPVFQLFFAWEVLNYLFSSLLSVVKVLSGRHCASEPSAFRPDKTVISGSQAFKARHPVTFKIFQSLPPAALPADLSSVQHHGQTPKIVRHTVCRWYTKTSQASTLS